MDATVYAELDKKIWFDDPKMVDKEEPFEIPARKFSSNSLTFLILIKCLRHLSTKMLVCNFSLH